MRTKLFYRTLGIKFSGLLARATLIARGLRDSGLILAATGDEADASEAICQQGPGRGLGAPPPQLAVPSRRLAKAKARGPPVPTIPTRTSALPKWPRRRR